MEIFLLSLFFRLPPDTCRGKNRVTGKAALGLGSHFLSQLLEGCSAGVFVFTLWSNTEHQGHFSGEFEFHSMLDVMKSIPPPVAKLKRRYAFCHLFQIEFNFGQFLLMSLFTECKWYRMRWYFLNFHLHRFLCRHESNSEINEIFCQVFFCFFYDDCN